ncbi:MAG: radical SAM protein [candidate division Zixibacteria bacterium]|nr:radical SAM protein [candidate division Zixibacteria bacterium]MDH3936705.1 radical SAM protein [candidate division Zixibacteria bacterium]MDH4032558.1 radical SAM protein [candidate division Zixibacteria bacterium]
MRGLRELVFSTTNRCTARCQDCPIVTDGASSNTLTSQQMIDIVEEVLPWGTLSLVVFTGGEPLLLGDELVKTVAYVSKHDISTRIVTNAYWAHSEAAARQTLERLKDAGLTEINISCDDYHQEFVPLEYVRNANIAATKLGIPALIGHRIKQGGKITKQSLSKYLGVELHKFERGKKNPDHNVINCGPNVPITTQIESYSDTSETGDLTWRGPCASVLKSIIVSSDLRVQICCGIISNSVEELYIGSLKDDNLLTIIQRGNEDLIANWLALSGPSSVLEFVREKAPEIDLPTQYVNRCHLCNELFTRPDVREVLHEHAAERGSMVGLMRGVLDWMSDDWAPQRLETRNQSPGTTSAPDNRES